MMSRTPPEIDSLIHALMSPLTALQGAVQLIRRRLAGSDDAEVDQLLASLDRNSARLRAICTTLIDGASSDGVQVQISLPVAALGQRAVWLQNRNAAPTQTSQTSGVAGQDTGSVAKETAQVLVLAAVGSHGEEVALALREQGHTVVHVANAVTGLDMARGLRPELILVEPGVEGPLETVMQILGEDPETKAIPLEVLSHGPLAASMHQPALLEPDQPLTVLVAQLEQILAPGLAAREGHPHVLVVDDEEDVARIIALQFADEGYQTTQVYSGTAALQIVREQSFDLILLDVLLPDIDGFAVLGGLRAQPETQLTPIILVSAVNAPSDKVRGLQLGADDYITKPFSAAELSARAQAALRRSEREGGANPSTRLPGNLAIERAISQRIADRQPFAVCYCDIDNFKAYNDSYGFLKGDAVIQRTAQILLEVVRSVGNPDDFVGHIGGDDFVVISTAERAEVIGITATKRFDETAPFFYDPLTRSQGFLKGVDRQGQPTDFPLVSLTITAVISALKPFRHPGEVAQRSAEGKKRGKRIPGSVYLSEEPL